LGFDSVDRVALWGILSLCEIPPKLLDVLAGLYTGLVSAVQSGGRTSAFFPLDSGDPQGCVLAPTMFNACMDWVLRRVVGSSGCGAFVSVESFTDLDFADDAVILAESMEALIGALERLSEESECLGLWVSWIKTKIQAFNDFLGTAISNVSVCGGGVDLVKRFTYLGSDIHVSGDSSYEVSRWIGRRTKVQVFRVLVLPALLYGCETWTLYKMDYH
uniref:Reverse transcriptase domain-containing protein n=1 Tax=Paramormyrops kingsleyae TaxID=1676925 RepID=A0A3B3TD90_9TELE